MSERTGLAADLPDAVVDVVPVLLDETHERPLQRPREGILGDAGLPGLVERDHDLADHIPLELIDRGVAHPYRRSALVAGQRVQLAFGQVPLARESVHGLDVRGIAGDGAQQPVAPVLGFVDVRVDEERAERQRRITQPDVAVVPVALAPELLGPVSYTHLTLPTNREV